MYGPAKEPTYPTKIALIFKIVGWLFIIWSVANWLIAHTPVQTTLSAAASLATYGSILRSMGILYFILGIILILNGVAISKIIEVAKYEVDATKYQVSQIAKRTEQ